MDSAAVDEWVEWEAATLAPAERALAASKKADGAAPAEIVAALGYLDEKLTGTWLIEGVRQHRASYRRMLQSAV